MIDFKYINWPNLWRGKQKLQDPTILKGKVKREKMRAISNRLEQNFLSSILPWPKKIYIKSCISGNTAYLKLFRQPQGVEFQIPKDILCFPKKKIVGWKEYNNQNWCGISLLCILSYSCNY